MTSFQNKPVLQTVIDILDESTTILKKHSDTGKDSLAEIEKAIEQVKERLANYKNKF